MRSATPPSQTPRSSPSPLLPPMHPSSKPPSQFACRRSQRDEWRRIRDACERFQGGLGTNASSSAHTHTPACSRARMGSSGADWSRCSLLLLSLLLPPSPCALRSRRGGRRAPARAQLGCCSRRRRGAQRRAEVAEVSAEDGGRTEGGSAAEADRLSPEPHSSTCPHSIPFSASCSCHRRALCVERVSQTSAALAASVRELASRAEAQRARLQRTIDRQRAQIRRAAESVERLRGQRAA